MLSKATKLHATTTETPWACIRAKIQAFGCKMDPIGPIRVCIRAQVLPSPKGVTVCGDIRALGCTMKPTRVFPAGRGLLRQRGMADF
jgi:hypothetical protein